MHKYKVILGSSGHTTSVIVESSSPDGAKKAAITIANAEAEAKRESYRHSVQSVIRL